MTLTGLYNNANVHSLIRAEELNGARAANRFRYVLSLFFLLQTIVVSAGLESWLINGGAIMLYLLFTAFHSLLLKTGRLRLIRLFNYINLLLDYGLIVSMLIYYTFDIAEGNMVFALKNPMVYLLLLPLTLTAIQFRIRLVVFGLVVFLAIYAALIAVAWNFALAHGIETNASWMDYVNGPGLFLGDAIVARPIIFTVICLVIAYTIHRAVFMLKQIGTIESQKKQMSRYFSPQIADQITTSAADVTSGQRQRVSILFMDIRNFTAFSETTPPEELAAFLGQLRDRMTKVIFAHRGTLDKFIGDAIMATFGTPQSSPQPGEDSQNALRAARAMLHELDQINLERRYAGKELIQIGIGLHSGLVFAGTIGSGERLEYTVIGDTVNITARIESLCKKLDARLLVSADLLTETGIPADAEKMPRVQVKGKSEALQVYRIGPALSRYHTDESAPDG
ncbi:MAG: adenylate/guanylate cyclase domain-containing protein [Leptospiraceae bacterium]|nr:adenylate/guanylate cyclase domain-containing protein [Leptospiraceae bacterium]